MTTYACPALKVTAEVLWIEALAEQIPRAATKHSKRRSTIYMWLSQFTTKLC
jgi:hypothetical protein